MVEGLDLERIAQSFKSRYWRWQIHSGESVDSCVEEELTKRLPHIDPSSWVARFELGGVYLAGRPAVLGQGLQPPCRLEYYEPRVPIHQVADTYPKWSSDDVLYADDDLAVVIKPAGLPTTPARDQGQYHLQRYLEEHFKKAVHLPSRLDMAVAGVLLVSLSARMNRYLQRAYDAKRIEKYYMCEVVGTPPWDETVCSVSIERDPRHPVLRRGGCDSNSGESATTRLRKLSICDTGEHVKTLLQAEPLTGRTHQIRVHCQNLGFPIVGDPFYGGAQSPELRLASVALRFFHPYRAQTFAWELPPDRAPSWLINYPGCEIQYRL